MSKEEELDIWGSKEWDWTPLQAARAIRLANPFLHRRRRARSDLRNAKPLAFWGRAGEIDTDRTLIGWVVITLFGKLLIRTCGGGSETERRVVLSFLAVHLHDLILIVMGFSRFSHRAPSFHSPPALRRHRGMREAKPNSETLWYEWKNSFQLKTEEWRRPRKRLWIDENMYFRGKGRSGRISEEHRERERVVTACATNPHGFYAQRKDAEIWLKMLSKSGNFLWETNQRHRHPFEWKEILAEI